MRDELTRRILKLKSLASKKKGKLSEYEQSFLAEKAMQCENSEHMPTRFSTNQLNVVDQIEAKLTQDLTDPINLLRWKQKNCEDCFGSGWVSYRNTITWDCYPRRCQCHGGPETFIKELERQFDPHADKVRLIEKYFEENPTQTIYVRETEFTPKPSGSLETE